MHFRVNSPEVISETIQGETIIINLASGTYYSLQGSGAEIWDAIEQQAPMDEIVERLQQRYDAEPAVVEGAVRRLVGELEAQGLVSADHGAGAPVVRGESVDADRDAERRPFAEPLLEVFTDMQDLVLLDPVHEVDERGWPHAPDAAVAGT